MKILYGIQGTGNGHISRSREVLKYLCKEAEVDILVSGIHHEVDLGFETRYKLDGLGFMFGKKLEAVPQLNRTHVMVSLGLTIAPMLFIVLHQSRVGNLGPKSDGQLCGELCLKEGYAASGMPAQDSGERRCLCYDDSGRVILDVPIETLAPRK